MTQYFSCGVKYIDDGGTPCHILTMVVPLATNVAAQEMAKSEKNMAKGDSKKKQKEMAKAVNPGKKEVQESKKEMQEVAKSKAEARLPCLDLLC